MWLLLVLLNGTLLDRRDRLYFSCQILFVESTLTKADNHKIKNNLQWTFGDMTYETSHMHDSISVKIFTVED